MITANKKYVAQKARLEKQLEKNEQTIADAMERRKQLKTYLKEMEDKIQRDYFAQVCDEMKERGIDISTGKMEDILNNLVKNIPSSSVKNKTECEKMTKISSNEIPSTENELDEIIIKDETDLIEDSGVDDELAFLNAKE